MKVLWHLLSYLSDFVILKYIHRHALVWCLRGSIARSCFAWHFSQIIVFILYKIFSSSLILITYDVYTREVTFIAMFNDIAMLILIDLEPHEQHKHKGLFFVTVTLCSYYIKSLFSVVALVFMQYSSNKIKTKNMFMTHQIQRQPLLGLTGSTPPSPPHFPQVIIPPNPTVAIFQ